MKKHRWHAWDSNPGRQDGRRRQIHWAMAAPLHLTVLIDDFNFIIFWCRYKQVSVSPENLLISTQQEVFCYASMSPNLIFTYTSNFS